MDNRPFHAVWRVHCQDGQLSQDFFPQSLWEQVYDSIEKHEKNTENIHSILFDCVLGTPFGSWARFLRWRTSSGPWKMKGGRNWWEKTKKMSSLSSSSSIEYRWWRLWTSSATPFCLWSISWNRFGWAIWDQKFYETANVMLKIFEVREGLMEYLYPSAEVEFVHAVSAGGRVKFLPAE